MSHENVEIVRRLFEVYNERSFGENADLIDSEMIWDFSRAELPDGSSYTGRSEFLSFIEAWEEGFETEHMEAREILDAGDRVVVTVNHRGRGMRSGIEIDQTFAMVWTLRHGRAVRMALFPTRADALEALGLSEQDAHADS
jgi:ketosteroid isomerase-like protein